MEFWWIAPIYVVLFLVGNRRVMAVSWLFALMEGIFLSQYCFFYLPQIFVWDLVGATITVLAGILVASHFEERLPEKIGNIRSPMLFFCCVLLFAEVSLGFVHGVLGGAGLYYATGAVLPEISIHKEDYVRSIGGIVGFLVGTLLLFYL